MIARFDSLQIHGDSIPENIERYTKMDGENNKLVFLWGGRQKANIVQTMVSRNGDIVSLIFDDQLEKPDFDSPSPFTSNIDEAESLARDCTHFVVCIGDGRLRLEKSHYCQNSLELAPYALIHETAFVSDTATLGFGAQLMAGAIIGEFVEIGNCCIVNTGAQIDHNCEIGDGVHFMGGATLAGNVRVGNFVDIGTNATILPDIKIGDGAFVGAGAVVTKDVAPNTVVTGVPARQVRKN